ncbi:hypothetical protein HK405_006962, partial [Cladochytrium tenue]
VMAVFSPAHGTTRYANGTLRPARACACSKAPTTSASTPCSSTRRVAASTRARTTALLPSTPSTRGRPWTAGTCRAPAQLRRWRPSVRLCRQPPWQWPPLSRSPPPPTPTPPPSAALSCQAARTAPWRCGTRPRANASSRLPPRRMRSHRWSCCQAAGCTRAATTVPCTSGIWAPGGRAARSAATLPMSAVSPAPSVPRSGPKAKPWLALWSGVKPGGLLRRTRPPSPPRPLRKTRRLQRSRLLTHRVVLASSPGPGMAAFAFGIWSRALASPRGRPTISRSTASPWPRVLASLPGPATGPSRSGISV